MQGKSCSITELQQRLEKVSSSSEDNSSDSCSSSSDDDEEDDDEEEDDDDDDEEEEEEEEGEKERSEFPSSFQRSSFEGNSAITESTYLSEPASP